MKTYARYLVMLCALSALVAVALLLAAPSAVGGSTTAILPPEHESQPADTLSPNRPEAPLPVIFPPDPGWPQYAQREITVHPEPPIPGQPTEICAWVVNTTGTTQTVTLDFGVANFGIGLLFDPLGTRTIQVPPFAKVKACVVWVPREAGHWCIQVLLHQSQQLDLKSQRNIDVWEALEPGKEAITTFDVRNPSTTLTDTIQMRAPYIRPNWSVTITPPLLPQMGPGETQQVTLTVRPPDQEDLGSRAPIVDVEAWSGGGQGILIGGFRKMDVPPVLLHRPKDPPYAESEISIDPYPPLPGEPTKICVELRNLTGVAQTVDVGFMVADFGIGLPFDRGIGGQVTTIPSYGKTRVCVTWIPEHPGQFCVRVNLDIPRNPPYYARQTSQLNLDVRETLRPGQPHSMTFRVGNYPDPVYNPAPATTDISLTVMKYLPGWVITLTPDVLLGVAPGQDRPVTLTVQPPAGKPMPDDGVPVVDVEANYQDGQRQWKLLGGFRKIFRPPVPIHRPQEPRYSESEISVNPYPPRVGEPVRICAELRNPTPDFQFVDVEFGIVGFGIGLPFQPIDLQPNVELPPFSKTRVCTQWVPYVEGHFCAQITIRQEGYLPIKSQRNMDVAENLQPGIPDRIDFPIGNPFDKPITITLGLVRHLFDWQAELSHRDIFNLQPHMTRTVALTVTPPGNLSQIPDEEPVLDVEAFYWDDLETQWIPLGGFRKIFRPPVPIHHPEDPPYAEREISVEPYPPRAGEPTEICVELRNPTAVSQTIGIEFAWANFGIGLPFNPVQRREVTLPPRSLTRHCVKWVPPFPGHFCVQVKLFYPQQRFRDVFSQRNIDVGEVFKPGESTRPFTFTVGNLPTVYNPNPITTTIELATFVHLRGWEARVEPRVLQDVPPGATRTVVLTVSVPAGLPLPPDDTPVVDVEAHTVGRPFEGRLVGGQLLGGFRKIYRPPVPIHRPQDPIYAESEIHINPYPPREREPTEICVDLRNPTDEPQTFTVTFAVANFGIGLPFHDIVRPITVTLPPNSIKQVCVTWVPPFGGHFCARVTLQTGNLDPMWSQRNMDVGEILIPGEPSHRQFLVGNPTASTVTVTLGMVPHLEGWQVRLSQDVLRNMQPHETRIVTLTVVPPRDRPAPPEGAPVVDVEGFIGRELIGGFRKLFHPPVPIHRPKDPVYAESEIFVDPYPTLPGLPTLLGAVVFNPTPERQLVTVTFEVANFGIGLPFTRTGITTPTMVLEIPPFGAARAKTIWIPPFGGHFCVRIWLRSAGHEPVWSQRNIDVGEPLRLGAPNARRFVIGNPMTEVVTITLALVNHRPGWTAEVWPSTLPNMAPGMTRTVALTVTPPLPPVGPERERERLSLADERPIVDLEAYVEGELIGGIRKIAKPPIPLHKPQDRTYAETEINVTPYPLVVSKPSTITTDIVNTGETIQVVRVLFGVANFGFGIPFTTTGILTTSTVVTLSPGMSQTVSTVWTPPFAGDWCIQIILEDYNNEYPPQKSQRNVHVERRPFKPCEPFTKEFWLYNNMPLEVTVTIGASAINLPAGWTYSTVPTETVLAGYHGITVTVTITPPCQIAAQALLSPLAMMDTGGASGPPTIDVEGYTEDGELLGGIQIQLESITEYKLYLPLVLKQ